MENCLRLFAVYNNGCFTDLTIDFFSIYRSHLQMYAGERVPALKVLEGPLHIGNNMLGICVRVFSDALVQRLPDVEVQAVYYAHKPHVISDHLFDSEESALNFLRTNPDYKLSSYVVSRWPREYTINLIKVEVLRWFTETFPQTGKAPIHFIGYKTDSQPVPVMMPDEKHEDYNKRVDHLNACRKEEAEFPEKMKKAKEDQHASYLKSLDETLNRHLNFTAMLNKESESDDESDDEDKKMLEALKETHKKLNNLADQAQKALDGQANAQWGKPGTVLQEVVDDETQKKLVLDS